MDDTETPKVTPPTKEHQATMHQVHHNQPKRSLADMFKSAIQHYHGRKMSLDELDSHFRRLNPGLPSPFKPKD